MAKPIFIIECPWQTSKEQAIQIGEIIERRFPDYNTLGITSRDSDNFNFKVFNANDFEDIDFEDLKKLLKEAIA